MGLRDSISKGIGKANCFVNEQQRRYRLKESLDNENAKLSALFNELGKVTYYGAPIVTGRDAQVIKDEITVCKNNIESLNLQLSEKSGA